MNINELKASKSVESVQKNVEFMLRMLGELSKLSPSATLEEITDVLDELKFMGEYMAQYSLPKLLTEIGAAEAGDLTQSQDYDTSSTEGGFHTGYIPPHGF